MKFKPNSTHKPNETSWTTEHGYYAILASEDRVTVQTRPPDSDWMHIMPFDIHIEDPGMTAFVVRGIMDVLRFIPNEPDLAEATDMVRAYLERLCSGKDDDYRSATMISSVKPGLQFLKGLGKRRVYHVRRDHIRRYMKDNAGSRGTA